MMRKYIDRALLLVVFVGLMMVSCVEKKAITSKGLEGYYEVELSTRGSLNSNDDEFDEFALSMMSMALDASNVTFKFEEKTLLLDASGFLINMYNMASEQSIEFPIVYEYEIRNDSILYVRDPNDSAGDYDEFAVVSKIGESYDYLRVRPLSQDTLNTIWGDDIVFTLRRIVK